MQSRISKTFTTCYQRRLPRRIINKYPAKTLVRIRKEQHIEFRSRTPEPFIGDPDSIPEVIASNPIISVGIAPNPRARPELNADLYGTISTPGVVEGIVNIIQNEDEFDASSQEYCSNGPL